MSLLKRTLCLLLCILNLFPAFVHAEEATATNAAQKIVVTFLGDCTLGSEEHERAKETSFDSYVLQNGYAYPFSGVYDILSADDLTIANLEGVFYDHEANKKEKTYNFRASMDFAKVLPSGSVEAVSLANNHIEDYGHSGVRDTVAALENEQVSWFATTQYADNVYIYEKDGIKIGFVSVYISFWWNHLDMLKADIQKLHDDKCDVICAVMHGGVEYDTHHGESQEKLANFFIRNGASVVVGHHPHILQGYDIRDNASIFYSLGNFVFGGNKKMRAYQTAMAQFTFSFDENGEYLGHQLNIIPCQYSGSREYNDYRPILVQGEEAHDVIATIQDDSDFTLNPYQEGVGAVQPFVPAPVPTEETAP